MEKVNKFRTRVLIIRQSSRSTNSQFYSKMLFEVFIICVTLSLLWIIGKLLVVLDVVYVPKKKSNHLWHPAKNASQAYYCSICEIMLSSSSGFYCESCGISADTQCIQTAEVVLKCKENSQASSDKTVRDQLHMWVKGNLMQSYVCCVCEREIDYHGRPGLYGKNETSASYPTELKKKFFVFAGYRCCWCQRSTHVNCFVKTVDNKVCDFGRYRNLIVPPNHVFTKRRRLRRITSIVTPNYLEWKPLIVVGRHNSFSIRSLTFIQSIACLIFSEQQILNPATAQPLV